MPRWRSVNPPDGISTLPPIAERTRGWRERAIYTGAYTHAVKALPRRSPLPECVPVIVSRKEYKKKERKKTERRGERERERRSVGRSVSPTISHTRARRESSGANERASERAGELSKRPVGRQEYEKEKVGGRESWGGR